MREEGVRCPDARIHLCPVILDPAVQRIELTLQDKRLGRLRLMCVANVRHAVPANVVAGVLYEECVDSVRREQRILIRLPEYLRGDPVRRYGFKDIVTGPDCEACDEHENFIFYVTHDF